MLRKPAIILALTAVLLLFVSYQAGDRLLETQRSPDFTVLDSFLRHSAATGDWKFDTHSTRSYRALKPGWWQRLGIRRHASYDRDGYRFINTLTTERVLISLWRENGKVIKIDFTGGSLNAKTFEDVTFLRFPALSHPRYKP